MKLTTIGIDVAKEVFGLHGVDAGGVLLNKRISRKGLLAWLARLGTVPGRDGGLRFGSLLAREIERLGHTVSAVQQFILLPQG